MKPQTAAFLAKSYEFLDKAHDLFGAYHWPDEAGRAAYLAGLHAAQALIFEMTGQLRKRHSTVQGEFARLVRDDPRFDAEGSVAKIMASHNQTLAAVVQVAIWNSPSIKMA